MSKRDYIQTNKDWLEAKANEKDVKALPKGIYYKVLSEGNQNSGYTSFMAQRELIETAIRKY